MKNNPGYIFYLLVSLISVAVGFFFIFIRPFFLPEDLNFIGINQNNIEQFNILEPWLKNVFTVLGGFIIACGLLKFTILRFATFNSGVLYFILIFAAVCSSGLMSFINFKINSHYKWPLLALFILEIAAIVLLKLKNSSKNGVQYGSRQA